MQHPSTATCTACTSEGGGPVPLLCVVRVEGTIEHQGPQWRVLASGPSKLQGLLGSSKPSPICSVRVVIIAKAIDAIARSQPHRPLISSNAILLVLPRIRAQACQESKEPPSSWVWPPRLCTHANAASHSVSGGMRMTWACTLALLFGK